MSTEAPEDPPIAWRYEDAGVGDVDQLCALVQGGD